MSNTTVTKRQSLIASLVKTGQHGTKSTLARKSEAVLDAMWNQYLADFIGEEDDTEQDEVPAEEIEVIDIRIVGRKWLHLTVDGVYVGWVNLVTGADALAKEPAKVGRTRLTLVDGSWVRPDRKAAIAAIVSNLELAA